MTITRLSGANAITGTLPATNINDTSIWNITALPNAVKGMDRLATTSVSSSTSAVLFDVNANNDSTFNNYSHYIIYMANLLGDGASGAWRMRIGVSNSSDIKTSSYFRNMFGYKPDGPSIVQGYSTSADAIWIAENCDLDNTSRPQFGELHFFKKGNNATTKYPGAYGVFYAENTGGYYQAWHFQGSYETSNDINYVQITASTGNITKGDFTLIGVRNS